MTSISTPTASISVELRVGNTLPRFVLRYSDTSSTATSATIAASATITTACSAITQPMRGSEVMDSSFV